jgi:hypothetical protein
MAPQAVETWTSLLKDQTPAIALMKRNYRIPDWAGDAIDGDTIGGTLPTLRFQADGRHFDARQLEKRYLCAIPSECL